MDYSVKIKDSDGQWIQAPVSKEIFELFEEERKRDAAYIRYCKRHNDSRDFDVLQSCKSLSRQCASAEERYYLEEQIQQVRDILAECTPKQQERYLLYLQGFSYTQIALLQQCKRQPVKKSIQYVEKRLQIFLHGGVRLA